MDLNKIRGIYPSFFRKKHLDVIRLKKNLTFGQIYVIIVIDKKEKNIKRK